MLNKICIESEDFLQIVDYYYEKENFHTCCEIFKKLLRIYDEVKENNSDYDKLFIKVDKQQMIAQDEEEIYYRMDLEILKLNYPDYFLTLVKYLNNFAEEVISFIKVILHIEHILATSDGKFTKKINFYFANTRDVFSVTSSDTCTNPVTNLKINTYVEFDANIKKLTALKTVNSKIKVYCSLCGLLFTKNVTRIQSNKMFNSFSLTNDKKFHACADLKDFDQMKAFSQKIYREYTDPVLIRYLLVEIIPFKKESGNTAGFNFYSGNNSLICICKEKLLPKFPTWESIKISGIVKTRPDGNLSGNSFNSNDNFFEKILDITNVEKSEEVLFLNSFERMSLNNQDDNYRGESNNYSDPALKLLSNCPILTSLNISPEDISRFEKLSSFKTLYTYLLINLINPKISSTSFDFLNILSLYFIFSKKINLKVHIFDHSKSDFLKFSLQTIKNISESYYTFHDFSFSNNNSDELLTYNQLNNKNAFKFKSDDFVFKFGSVFSAHDKFLLIHNLPSNLNQNLLSFLTMNTVVGNMNVVSHSNESLVVSKFKSFSSLLTTTKLERLKGNNKGGNSNTSNSVISNDISHLIQYYDMISFYSDKMDSDRDRKRTDLIIENQFHNKKRKISDISGDFTQKSISNMNMNNSEIWLGSSMLNYFNQDDLYQIDTLSFAEFYKKLIKSDLDSIKKAPFLNELGTRDLNFIVKYIGFVNEFIFPKISNESKEIINHLSLHTIHAFSDLLQFELFNFDSQGSSVNRIMTKLSMINARIKMKTEVDREDILHAYFFTKEIVQQNFLFYLNSKREVVNKTKKNKMNFVMEKIKQIAAINSTNIVKNSDIKEACEYANLSVDLDNIIENLNYLGLIIKVGNGEYQITN